MIKKYNKKVVKNVMAFILAFLVVIQGSSVVFAGTGHDVLGVYKGAAGGDTLQKVSDYQTWLGRSVDYVEDFEDNANWANISGPAWLLNYWRDSAYYDKFAIAVPMLPTDPNYTLAIGATGAYDSYYTTLANNLVSKNLSNATIRLGWEMNGWWYSWSVTGGKETHFKNYFQKIVTAMRAVPGQNFKFVWNPTVCENIDLTLCYPGNAYVDYIGVDCYDQSWVANSYPIPGGATEADKLARWSNAWAANVAGPWGLNWFKTFSQQNSKPLVVCEWGVNTKTDGHGGGDNPYFIEWMHNWMDENNIAWNVYFDFRSSDLQNDHMLSEAGTSHPRAAAKFRELWSPMFSKASFSQGTQSLSSDNTGTVIAEFDITPNGNNINAITGYADSSTTIADYPQMSMAIRMSATGYFDVRNGAAYAALTNVPYSSGNTYHVKMLTNITAKTYSVWVTPPAGSQTLIASNYAFRSDAPAIDDLGKICLKSNVDNDYKITNHTIPAWHSKADYTGVYGLGTTNTGTRTTEFDITPLAGSLNAITGYADTSTTITGFSSMAMALRMYNNIFDVRNGAAYAAVTNVPYVAGNTYHVKMVTNLTAKTYSVWITPPSGSATQIANNYAFRSDAPVTDDLGKVCVKSDQRDQFKIKNHIVY